ncbi:MAG: response regulator transcription factor [Lachnospiraceae bacterium]|nr:response regulator transcription factor [Lachnospiraceae bacterium]
MRKLMIVDDEKKIRRLLSDYFSKEGYEVLEAEDGEKALRLFEEEEDISLIILDIMMPKKNGYEVLQEIRKTSSVPVILLTAKSEEEDELKGFESGADEYVTKPFSPRTLVARAEAIFRRLKKTDKEDVLSIGGIVLNKTSHTVTVDGEAVELSFKEFELLSYFMENVDIALSREMILNSVWNYDYFGDARTIDTHVKKLRAKLGSKGEMIHTIWGMGYKFKEI